MKAVLSTCHVRLARSSRNQLAVTAAAFVGFTGSTLVMPFLALYIAQLGVRDVGEIALWTGLTIAVTPAISALCAPVWGRVGDRFGNKLLVQRSLLSFVIVMAAMAFVTRAWHLFALRAVQGLVAGYGPLTIAMAASSAPRERMAQAIGMVQTAQRIGPAIGPVIGGLLAGVVGLRHSFLVAAAVYAGAFVLLTMMYQEPPRPAVTAGQARGRVAFADILALENFLLLMALILALPLVERSFSPVLPLYLEHLGFGTRVPVVAGLLLSALALSGALGHQLAAMLLPHFSARVVIAGAVLVAALALAIFSAASALWLLMVAMAVTGLGIGTAMTAAFTAAGAVIPPEAHGASFGFLTSASLTGNAIGPIAGGLVAVRSISVVFISGSVMLALLALLVRRVMVERNLPMHSAPPLDEE